MELPHLDLNKLLEAFQMCFIVVSWTSEEELHDIGELSHPVTHINTIEGLVVFTRRFQLIISKDFQDIRLPLERQPNCYVHLFKGSLGRSSQRPKRQPQNSSKIEVFAGSPLWDYMESFQLESSQNYFITLTSKLDIKFDTVIKYFVQRIPKEPWSRISSNWIYFFISTRYLNDKSRTPMEITFMCNFCNISSATLIQFIISPHDQNIRKEMNKMFLLDVNSSSMFWKFEKEVDEPEKNGFDNTIAEILLQKMLVQKSLNITFYKSVVPSHATHGSQRFNKFRGSHLIAVEKRRRRNIIVHQTKYFNFMTCDPEVVNEITNYRFFLKPFDQWTWLFIEITFGLLLIYFAILGILFPGNVLETVTYLMLNLLSRPFLQSRPTNNMKYAMVKASVSVIDALILVLVADILTNVYLALFMTDIILPSDPRPIASTLEDIYDFQFYGSRHVEVLKLELAIAFKPGVSVAENDALVQSISSNSRWETIPQQDRNSWDRILKNSCHKIAYVDLTDNIDNALSYANDYFENEGIKLIKGKEHRGVTPMGWEFETWPYNYPMQALQLLISSGITKYWKEWFDRFEMLSLLRDARSYHMESSSLFVDKSQVRSTSLSKDSKILSCFYIFLFCICIDVVIFVLEIGKSYFFVCFEKHF